VQRYLPQIRATNFLKAKVKVDEAASSPDQKAAVWGMIVQLMPVLQHYNIPPDVFLMLMRYSPLPSSLLDAIEKIMSQPPDPAIEKAKQLQLAETEAGIEKDKSAAMLNVAKAQSEGQPDMSNVLSALANMQATRLGMQADEHKANLDMATRTQKFGTDMATMEAKRRMQSEQAKGE
jgi:hypothetical protein